jgi:hypothetical protein
VVNAEPPHPGAGAPVKSKQIKATALRFRSHQDAVDFARNGIEDANRRATFHPINFVENYVNGRAHIVLKFATRTDAGKFELVFFSVPPHEKFGGSLHEARLIEAHIGSAHGNWNKQPMFVGVTKLIQSPKGIISSLVWIKGSKQVCNFLGQVFASAIDDIRELGGSVGEGEIGIFRFFDSSENGCGIRTLVKGRSEMFDSITASVSPTWWDWSRELKAMNRPPFRIYFLSTGVWCFVHESMNSLFQPIDILLCTGKPAFRTFKGIASFAHG